ncbi:splicing factor 3B subunit 3 [Trichonephila clavipes]|nr:splicing factor 3B subunit 3 [Trichonephila clavipes]
MDCVHGSDGSRRYITNDSTTDCVLLIIHYPLLPFDAVCSRVECLQGALIFDWKPQAFAPPMKHGQRNGMTLCLLMNPASACNITMVGFEFGYTVVKDIIVEYFDTIPVASALCFIGATHLFAASEFGNHHLYEINNAKDVEAVFKSSLPRSKDENVFFPPCSKNRLVKKAELPSLSPIMCMETILLHNKRPQMYLATGCGPSSSFKVLPQASSIKEIHRVDIKETFIDRASGARPQRFWIIDKTYVVDEKLLIVVSFLNSTVVYFFHEGSFLEYGGISFQLKTNTLLCAGIRGKIILQVCPEGAFLSVDGVTSVLWRELPIINAVATKDSLVLATNSKDIVFFVLYPDIIPISRIPLLQYCPMSLFFETFEISLCTLLVGDREGNLISNTLREDTKEFEVSENKCLGTKPALFYRVRILNEERNIFEGAILALSSSTWLKPDSAGEFVCLSFVIPSIISIHPNKRCIGVIDRDFFK